MGLGPELVEIRRSLSAPEISDLSGEVARQMERLLAESPVRPGATVAIGVGSRGIAELPLVVQGVVQEFRRHGALPFLVPAMGSHGGATPAGQIQVHRNLGVDAAALGIEVRAEMETDQLGTAPSGWPVHFSRAARQADHVFVINRVKPHTRFLGPVQSGLLKMLLIGLGKQAGAAACHRMAHHLPFQQLVAEGTGMIFREAPILGGLAIVENARDTVAHIEAIPATRIWEREPELLSLAESLMPRLPLTEIDLLIVDEIGKEISGSGMDTNIVGRKENDHVSGERDWCQTRLIYVRGLTVATGGNATGIGMAEFTRPEAVEQVDWHKTAINSITAGHPTAAMCPVVLASDREVLEAAESIVGHPPRLVHLRNTLHVEHLFVSHAILSEIVGREPSVQSHPPFCVQFDSHGTFTHHF